MKSKSQYTRTVCKTFLHKTSDMLTGQHATDTSNVFFPNKWHTKGKKCYPHSDDNKAIKDNGTFPSKIEERREICITSEESHCY